MVADLDNIVDTLVKAAAQLKGVEGVKELQGLTRALSDYAAINWSKFGRGAAEGLATFTGLEDSFKEVAKSLIAFESVSVHSVEVFKDLSKGLSLFSDIDWNGVKVGLKSIKQLEDTFTKAEDGFIAFADSVALLYDSSDNFQAFTLLSEALKTFSDIDWNGVKVGLKSIKQLEDTFTKAEDGFKAFAKAVKDLSTSSDNFEAFTLLSNSLKTFSDIDWNGVKVGLKSIKQLEDTFTKAEDGFKAFADSVALLYDSSKDFEAFTLLSEALKTFSDIDWNGVKVGLKSIKQLKDTFTEAQAGFKAFADSVALLSTSSKDFEAFTLLSNSLKTFSDIDWDGVDKGLETISVLKNTFTQAQAGFKAFAIAARGLKNSSKDFEAFTLLSNSLKTFSDIDWGGVDKGLETISVLKNTFTQAQAGFKAFAIAVKDLSNSSKDLEAFTLLSNSLKTFSDIDWDGVKVGLESIKQLKATFTEAQAGFKAFAKAIKVLSDSSKDLEAFTLLSNSLKTFSDIDWGKVIWGFTMMATLPKLIKVAANGFREFAIAARGLKNSSKDFEAFTLLSNSLKTFSEIAWGKVILGFAMMAILPKLIKVAANGFKEFAIAVRGLKNSSKDFEGFKALSESLKAFGDIKWGKVLFGLIALKMISPLFKVFGKAVNELGKSIGSKEAKQTIQSFVQFTNALKTFGEIRWGMVFIGTVILRLFAGALKVFASAQGAMNISMKMLKVFVKGLSSALTQLGVAATNPLFWIGMAALAAFALILIGFGVACVLAGVGVLLIAIAFERFMKAAFDGIEKMIELGKSAPELLKAALAIQLVSAAMIAFAAAGVVSSGGGLISGFFDKITPGMGPMEKIMALAQAADGLDKTATALERINAALNAMPSKDGIDLSVAGSEGAQNASNARTAAHTAGQNSAGGGKKTINNKVSTVVFNNSWMPDRSSALILAHAF